MSITFAPSPWPAPAHSPPASTWRFARELRGDTQAPALQWRMARQGSFSAAPLLAVYALLCVLALGIGAAFWWLGAPGVLPFAGLELMLLGVALWISFRHAGDSETLTLVAHELTVEHRFGRLVERAVFRAEWVRVEPVHGEGSLVELSGQAQRLRVGRYLRPELRSALARELRLALRRQGHHPTTEVQARALEPQR